jgi:threonine/homoserine/homoserine lactone efflux protein
MTQLLADMISAAVLGLFIAIPFGPVCLMCVQRTLASGIWFGIASGIGAATAHGMFSCLAAVSASVLTQMTVALHTPLRITGGIVLVFMGLRATMMSTRAAHGATCGDLFSAYTSTLLVAAANPLTLLPYLGVASALTAGEPLIMDRALATSFGVMLGSASWYLVLALGTNAMFRGLQKAALDRLSRLAGIPLMALGAALCVRTV